MLKYFLCNYNWVCLNYFISTRHYFDHIEHIMLKEQFSVRNVLGTKTLGDILSDRESIALEMQTVLDEGTEPWGVKVERVEVISIMTSVTSSILMTMTITTAIT